MRLSVSGVVSGERSAKVSVWSVLECWLVPADPSSTSTEQQ